MIKLEYTVKNPEGLDARLAGMLVKEAAKCSGRVTVCKEGRTGDAMSIFNLLALSVKAKEQIEIIVEGGDEEIEAMVLEAFIKENL